MTLRPHHHRWIHDQHDRSVQPQNFDVDSRHPPSFFLVERQSTDNYGAAPGETAGSGSGSDSGSDSGSGSGSSSGSGSGSGSGSSGDDYGAGSGSSTSSSPSPSNTCGSNGSSSCTSFLTAAENSETLPIVLGVVLPVTFIAVALFVIWRIVKKRQRLEEAQDKHASLDFGLGEVSRQQKGVGKRKPVPGQSLSPEMLDLTKAIRSHRGGMSMDMRSPYLLASESIEGRRSFNSMSRSMHDGEDPYRPVELIRSESPSLGLSPYSSRPGSRKDSASVWTHSSEGLTGMKGSLIRHAEMPSRTTPPGLSTGETPLLSAQSPQPSPLEMPSPVLRKPVGQAASSPEINRDLPAELPATTSTAAAAASEPQTNKGVGPLGFDFGIPSVSEMPSPSIHITQDPADTDAQSLQPPPRGSSAQASHEMHESAPPEFDDDYETYADVLGIVQKETNLRYSTGLGVQGVSGLPGNRLSANLRPLPPDDVEENPEARANRIRSFYREYFDERRDTRLVSGYGAAQYYEDYGQEYMNTATVVDPQTGRFVVGNNAPFAQPITRRAMTPPPRGPPRFMNGPGSGAHGRGHSTVSGQGARGRAAKRKLPPPQPLNNLPTPHLMKDDFSIFHAMEFAPKITYRDIQAGRPDSPKVEKRPYSPIVRPFTPLASSFDELRVMPSPHLLRKSSTFTGLDFALPPRFHGDGASDNHSIRSGRSNMSANIRAGAYRVSRIPKGVVGTKDDLAVSLRPTWDLRGPFGPPRS